MAFLKILKKLVINTSLYFTAITPIYAAIQIIIDTSEAETAMSASWLLYLFLFSFLGALSQLVYNIKSINKAIRATLQCIILMISAYICFFIPLELLGGTIMVGLAFVAIIYFACFGIGSFFIWRYRKLTKKEEIYEAKYKKK